MRKLGQLLSIFTLLILSTASFAGEQDINNDELAVGEKAVVFFSITQAEYDLFDDQRKSETDEVLSDFYHYRGKVDSFLKKNGIKNILTAKSKLLIIYGENESITYVRNDFGHIVGLVMTDKVQEPKLFLGVATDVGLITMFKEYFQLK